jgi:hypothetical protein
MNDPNPASEEIAETEPGIDQKQFGTHLGHMDPDQQQPDGGSEEQTEAQPTEDGAATPAAGEEDAAKKPDDDALQRKVGELAFENRQLKRQLEAGQAPVSDDTPPEPLKTLKDFNYDEQAFNEYLIEEGARRGEERAVRRQQEATVRTEAERRADEFASREDAFEAENPGFKERLHDDNLHISQEMAMFIADPANEVGLHVGDFLARNPTEAARIAGLPPTAQFREMVALESKVSKEVAKVKAEKDKASGAPPPPTQTVGEGDPGIGDVDPSSPKSDKLSDEEWLRQRQKQLNAKR